MPLSKINLKNIKKTEQSLGERTGRVPYITAAGNAESCTTSGAVFIKLKCAHQSLGDLVKTQILVQ